MRKLPPVKPRKRTRPYDPREDQVLLDPEWEILRPFLRIDPKGYPRLTFDAGHQLLHRYVVDAPPGTRVDHCFGNLLDARHHRLRIVTHKVNMANSNVVRNPSGFRGVRFKGGGAHPWVAYYRGRYLAGTSSAEEANRIRLRAEFNEVGIQPRRRQDFIDAGLISSQDIDKPCLRIQKGGVIGTCS